MVYSIGPVAVIVCNPFIDATNHHLTCLMQAGKLEVLRPDNFFASQYNIDHYSQGSTNQNRMVGPIRIGRSPDPPVCGSLITVLQKKSTHWIIIHHSVLELVLYSQGQQYNEYMKLQK